MVSFSWEGNALGAKARCYLSHDSSGQADEIVVNLNGHDPNMKYTGSCLIFLFLFFCSFSCFFCFLIFCTTLETRCLICKLYYDRWLINYILWSFNIESIDVQLFIDYEFFLLIFKLHCVDISISGFPPTSHLCGSGRHFMQSSNLLCTRWWKMLRKKLPMQSVSRVSLRWHSQSAPGQWHQPSLLIFQLILSLSHLIFHFLFGICPRTCVKKKLPFIEASTLTTWTGWWHVIPSSRLIVP